MGVTCYFGLLVVANAGKQRLGSSRIEKRTRNLLVISIRGMISFHGNSCVGDLWWLPLEYVSSGIADRIRI